MTFGLPLVWLTYLLWYTENVSSLCDISWCDISLQSVTFHGVTCYISGESVTFHGVTYYISGESVHFSMLSVFWYADIQRHHISDNVLHRKWSAQIWQVFVLHSGDSNEMARVRRCVQKGEKFTSCVSKWSVESSIYYQQWVSNESLYPSPW